MAWRKAETSDTLQILLRKEKGVGKGGERREREGRGYPKHGGLITDRDFRVKLSAFLSCDLFQMI